MFEFSVGLVSFLVCALFGLVYLTSFSVRCVAAWLGRDEFPRDRVIPLTLLAVAMGFVIGSMVQPKWEMIQNCQIEGLKLVPCIFQRAQQSSR